MSEGNTLSDVPTFCEVQLMSAEKGMIKKPSKTLSKKVLIREIAELSDAFDFPSLERTNIKNLLQIKILLDSK